MGYTLLKEKEEGEHITLRDGDERFADLIAHHASGERPAHRVAPDDPAVILMSGGTTGTPKGVVGSHRGMVAAGMQLRAWLRSAMNEWSDIIMLPLPLFHTYGNTGVQSLAFVNHNPMCLIPDPRDFGGLLKEIATVKPAFIQRRADAAHRDPESPAGAPGQGGLPLDQALLLRRRAADGRDASTASRRSPAA